MAILQTGFGPSGLLDSERVLPAAGLRMVRLIFTNLTEAQVCNVKIVTSSVNVLGQNIEEFTVNNSVKTQLWLFVLQNNRSFPVKGNLRCFLHTIAGESRPHVGLFF